MTLRLNPELWSSLDKLVTRLQSENGNAGLPKKMRRPRKMDFITEAIRSAIERSAPR